jgi:5-methylthioadenosine/S-adenosylhomocysteine deaminase
MAEYTLFSSSLLQASREKSYAPGGLLVSDEKIIYSGELRQATRLAPSGTERIDFPGAVISPGFVNAHSHLLIPPTLGMKGGDFTGWLLGVIEWKKGASGEELACNLRDSLRECAKSGITSVGEISYGDLSLIEDIPLRLRAYVEIIGMREEALSVGKEGVTRAFDSIDKGARTLRVGISPHSLYTCSLQTLKWCSEFSAEEDAPIQIHVGESSHEMEFVRTGKGEIKERVYDALSIGTGGFEGYGEDLPEVVRNVVPPGSALVHGTFLEADEIETLSSNGFPFIFCVRSNRFLTGEIPPLEVIDGELLFGLGTDSRGSCGKIDMFEEMRSFADGYHGSMGSQDLYGKLFESATLSGSKIIGYSDLTGSLEEGREADFFALELPSVPGKALTSIIEKGESSRMIGTFVGGRPITL